MIFVPADNTFHGFEKRQIQGVRTSLIINYVTNDWRAREQLSRRARCDFRGQPARHGPRERFEVGAGDARGAGGEEPGEIEASDLLRDVRLREDAIADHRPDARREQLPVRRHERGVRNGQTERVAEQRGDGKPVSETADHAGLGEREEQTTPPMVTERKGDDGERDGGE